MREDLWKLKVRLSEALARKRGRNELVKKPKSGKSPRIESHLTNA